MIYCIRLWGRVHEGPIGLQDFRGLLPGVSVESKFGAEFILSCWRLRVSDFGV